MRFLIDKLNSLKIGWNERELTERDFHRICKRLKINVIEMPLRTGGFYYRVMGRDYIAIDSRLTGPRKLLVQFHELAHFLLHTPESGATANFHNVGRKTRQEREADLVALCAVIPKSWLEARSLDEIVDEHTISADVLRERLDILEKHGI